MKTYSKIIFSIIVLWVTQKQYAQHHSKMTVVADMEQSSLSIHQEITFYNQSKDTLTTIVLNDWNNAFSDKESPLGKRFSDEFYNKFHLADQSDLGGTTNFIVNNTLQKKVGWERTKKNPDYIKILLDTNLLPNQKIKLILTYNVKIPSDKFTKYGRLEKSGMHLKDWFITPARYENHQFVKYSNENLDDIANGSTDFDIDLKIKGKSDITTDLLQQQISQTEEETHAILTGKNRTNFDLIIEKKSSYTKFKVNNLEVFNNINSGRFNDSLKAKIIERIVTYCNHHIGEYPMDKIIISTTDYEKNPFYGLNQLPKFMRPFHTDFLFEIKFLKTYLNNYLKNSLRLDPRKDNWIFDGIQIFSMMNYIDQYHHDAKMMGDASKYYLLRSFKMAQTDFNEQYSYYYMLMARKNLDQPLNVSKNTLIKYNVQIANKYKAGLSLKYLDDYLGTNKVSTGIKQFYELNLQKQTNGNDFEQILKSNSPQNIEWFFEYIIDNRKPIDYKFSHITKTSDSITFKVKNKGIPLVPMPIFGIRDKQVVFKKWLETNQIDTILTIERKKIDKLVLNYSNEVPEFNLRNNWKSLRAFSLNRPLKMTFFQDLEDPHRTQLFYVPTLFYNLYDGFAPGFSFYNYSLFDKPFMFNVNPMYSINTNSVIGSGSFAYNQYLRENRLYNIRYLLGASYYHYASDAAYLKLYPSVSFYIRQPNYRDNRKQAFTMKYNIIYKEPSLTVIDSTDNYSILNLKYYNIKTEITSHVKFLTDIQFSGYFGKISAEMEFRKLFNDNRYFNARVFAGTFIYNSNNTQNYNFGVSRVNDYLFDYAVYARSETTGILSQQFILGQGGFKSFVTPSEANQWLTTTNLSYSLLWNWVDAYADFGLIKNRNADPTFLYDSGIRLNLVQDYFELYFPIYSSNGFEPADKNYGEKIRFIFIFNPKSLINLFTRKWF
ncbi:aminopeptidase [Flavobacterium adhaerens]|uniref:aminopeptidase n=1 Tax=Flavobacterium adhaerens TaxID=3149043 RepID=UPI0032B5D598